MIVPFSQFVLAMARELDANDHKLGWESLTLRQLLARLRQETAELEGAIGRGGVEEIVSEAADVANFAMMIADNARATEEEMA